MISSKKQNPSHTSNPEQQEHHISRSPVLLHLHLLLSCLFSGLFEFSPQSFMLPAEIFHHLSFNFPLKITTLRPSLIAFRFFATRFSVVPAVLHPAPSLFARCVQSSSVAGVGHSVDQPGQLVAYLPQISQPAIPTLCGPGESSLALPSAVLLHCSGLPLPLSPQH